MGKKKDVHAVAMFFYCEWVGGLVRVSIEDTWVSCHDDCCGRYGPEIAVEFSCECGRQHMVSLTYPYERVR